MLIPSHRGILAKLVVLAAIGLNISLENYSQQFDIALESGSVENVHAWDLANLGGSINIQSLELGTIYTKESELEMEFQMM